MPVRRLASAYGTLSAMIVIEPYRGSQITRHCAEIVERKGTGLSRGMYPVC